MSEMDQAEVKEEFQRLVQRAASIVAELDDEVNEMLEDGVSRPLDARKAERLLSRVIEHLQEVVARRASEGRTTAKLSDVRVLIKHAMEARERVQMAIRADGPMVKKHLFHLLEKHNGIQTQPVVPPPVFHERTVNMSGGYVKTTDLKLWGHNERLDIHVNQFRAKHDRAPTPEELLHIMLGEMRLEGMQEEDEFEIMTLARSIGANGVRKPPIIDVDGTLLDGNRRVAACHVILNDTSGAFTSEEKKRAEYIYVWQLLDGATNDERDKVMVSLNFESDCKKDWPEYIKARKVFEEWDAMLALEPKKAGPQRQAEMKRELSKKYALGPDTGVVNRYLKMVKWAQDFEEHHINFRKNDKFAVKHASNRYFQYFDELGKGEKAGGVAYALENDETFKRQVFDLLFDGKITNWRQVREFKHVVEVPEAREVFAKAHKEPNVEEAQEFVDHAITLANSKRATTRALGANTRIEVFTKWLEEVPPRTLHDDVKSENLQRLLVALKLVESAVNLGLERAAKEA